jgi:hypothetical protein
MKNAWYNKNITQKTECRSVDNLQSLINILIGKLKAIIYRKRLKGGDVNVKIFK